MSKAITDGLPSKDGQPINVNEAPYPQELAELVEEIEYRPGWEFYLKHEDRGQGSVGLTLKILSRGYDTYHPENGEMYRVWHYFIVPAAAYDKRAWRYWLFKCLREVETHECAEFLQFGGVRPFAPNHGPGRDPYQVIEHGRVEDAETDFRGQRHEGTQV